MALLNTILDPILGLLTLLLFPNNYMNTAAGKQTYTLSRVNYVAYAPSTASSLLNYTTSFKAFVKPTATAISEQQFKLMLKAFMSSAQGGLALQYYTIIQQAMLAPGRPMARAVSNNNYNVMVTIVYIPDPDKTTVFAGGYDGVTFSSLPIPSHWITQQMSLYGAENEFDFDEESFYATFYPPGKYRITISAPGYAEQTWVIDAIEDPNPPVDEEPEE